MQIFDLWREYSYEKEYKTSIETAEDVFKMQKSAIKGISRTQGYKLILEFLESRKKASFELILKSNKDNVKAKGQYEEVEALLTFLKNLSADDVKFV